MERPTAKDTINPNPQNSRRHSRFIFAPFLRITWKVAPAFPSLTPSLTTIQQRTLLLKQIAARAIFRRRTFLCLRGLPLGGRGSCPALVCEFARRYRGWR